MFVSFRASIIWRHRHHHHLVLFENNVVVFENDLEKVRRGWERDGVDKIIEKGDDGS